MKTYLTKQDFQRFLSCPTAAYYGWQGLPSRNDGDEFLAHLATEGRIAGELARRLFAHARLIDEPDSQAANAVTLKALARGDCTLFEGCILAGSFLARPDVLIKRGKKLYLIEAKSKCGDMAAHRKGRMLITFYGGIRSEWREYVHDLSFQCEVVKRALPGYEVMPYLLLPEAQSAAPEEEIEAARIERPEYDHPGKGTVKQRREKSIFRFFASAKAIKEVKAGVGERMDTMAEILGSRNRPVSPLKYACRNCEFRLKDGNDPEDGWHECWGELAMPKPHLYELNQLYSLKTDGRKLLADKKIREGKTSLFDITMNELHGEHAMRQRVQLKNAHSDTEWIDPALGEALLALKWPIAFLDFETFASAVPWYAGMKPHELMPFQFSAHVLNHDGKVRHEEWLNVNDENPTLGFIRALRAALDRAGSILIYTDYEIRVLREARFYLGRMVPDSQSEQTWIDDLLRGDRLVDQHEWVHRWYFHPAMGGRTSIKKVLPAIWRSNSTLHGHACFANYFRECEGTILDPYKTLPSASVNGIDFEIREGCGAMRGYRELILGAGARCPKTKAVLAQMLRAYVSLDTVSQWIIFEHWRQRLGM